MKTAHGPTYSITNNSHTLLICKPPNSEKKKTKKQKKNSNLRTQLHIIYLFMWSVLVLQSTWYAGPVFSMQLCHVWYAWQLVWLTVPVLMHICSPSGLCVIFCSCIWPESLLCSFTFWWHHDHVHTNAPCSAYVVTQVHPHTMLCTNTIQISASKPLKVTPIPHPFQGL